MRYVSYQVLLNYERAHQLYVYGISNLSLSILIENELLKL